MTFSQHTDQAYPLITEAHVRLHSLEETQNFSAQIYLHIKISGERSFTEFKPSSSFRFLNHELNLLTGTLLHTHTHSVLTAIFPDEPRLASCPLNSPSPFIPGLCILLGQA